MKINIEIDVTDCSDCPFTKDHRGHGECWSYCGNGGHGQEPYGDILWGCGGEFRKTPEWCPIGLGK